jgi:hypothetical protein
MTPTNEAGHGLPERALAAWTGKHRGDAENRAFLAGYETCESDMNAALALSRGVPADMVLVPREMPDALAESREYVDGEFSRSNYETIYRLLAAAPAAAGAQGEDGCGACGNGCKDRAGCELAEQSPPIHQPAAADGGVRERSRELLAREVDADAAATPGLSIEAERIRNGKTDSAFVDAALRAIEAALSSHRQAGDESKFRELAERWRTEAEDNKHLGGSWHKTDLCNTHADELESLLTSPTTGADGVDS